MLEHLDKVEASRCNFCCSRYKFKDISFLGTLFQFIKELFCERKSVLPIAFKFESHSYILHMLPRCISSTCIWFDFLLPNLKLFHFVKITVPLIYNFILALHNPYECSCGIPCEEIEYTAQVSYSEFPDDGAAKILKHNHAYNKSMEYQR